MQDYVITEATLNKELDAIQIDVLNNDNLDYFHLHNKKEEVNGVFDANIHAYLTNRENIFFVNETPYIYEDGKYIRDNDGSILMTMIKKLIYPQYQKITTIKRVYGLFEADKWLKKSIDELNNYPKEWVMFKNIAYNARTREVIQHDSKYLALNQIPHDYDPSATPKCEKINQWLDSIMSPEDKEMLLQYAGLCMTRDTSQQKFLMFTGEGGTGKSLIIRLITSMVGYKNTASTDLKSLADNRFAKFNLLHKLLNCCADIDSTALNSIASIKLLTGEDPIEGEAKGKQPITFMNYAKLMFSANEIPRIKGEHTNAFYRRLLVIRLSKKPEKVNPNLYQELSSELDGFIHLCMDALYRLYQNGNIAESTNSKNETYKLRLFSDSVELFLHDKTVKDYNGKIPGKDLHNEYKKYCEENELTPVQKQTFFKACDDKGFSHADGRNVKGLIWKPSDFETANEEIPFE